MWVDSEPLYCGDQKGPWLTALRRLWMWSITWPLCWHGIVVLFLKRISVFLPTITICWSSGTEEYHIFPNIIRHQLQNFCFKKCIKSLKSFFFGDAHRDRICKTSVLSKNNFYWHRKQEAFFWLVLWRYHSALLRFRRKRCFFSFITSVPEETTTTEMIFCLQR